MTLLNTAGMLSYGWHRYLSTNNRVIKRCVTYREEPTEVTVGYFNASWGGSDFGEPSGEGWGVLEHVLILVNSSSKDVKLLKFQGGSQFFVSTDFGG